MKILNTKNYKGLSYEEIITEIIDVVNANTMIVETILNNMSNEDMIELIISNPMIYLYITNPTERMTEAYNMASKL